MNSFLLVCDVFSFVFLKNPRLEKKRFRDYLTFSQQLKFAIKLSLVLKWFLWLIHLFVLEQNGKWKALKSPVIEMPVSKNSDWLSSTHRKENQFWKICSAQLKLNHSTSRTDEMLYFSMPIKNAKCCCFKESCSQLNDLKNWFQ